MAFPFEGPSSPAAKQINNLMAYEMANQRDRLACSKAGETTRCCGHLRAVLRDSPFVIIKIPMHANCELRPGCFHKAPDATLGQEFVQRTAAQKMVQEVRVYLLLF